MKKSLAAALSTLLILVVLGGFGCAKKQLDGMPAGTARSQPNAQTDHSEEARLMRERQLAESAARDQLARENAERDRYAAQMNKADADKLIHTVIYFDYDSFQIREDSKESLQNLSALMKRYPRVKIVIEGYCDDRGTDEYNMALGDRRANAVKEFLTLTGVETNRLQTVSFGKEYPAVQGSSDAARAKNRRAEFKLPDTTE